MKDFEMLISDFTFMANLRLKEKITTDNTKQLEQIFILT